jgi:hypothetical protein
VPLDGHARMTIKPSTTRKTTSATAC